MFALVGTGKYELISIKTIQCAKYETVQEAIKSYPSSINDAEIISACIASAGTTHLDVFKPANNDWVINKSNVSSALNDIQVNWINDFSAQALATTTLQSNAVIVITQGVIQPEIVWLVLVHAPGSGTFVLLSSSNGLLPLPRLIGLFMSLSISSLHL